MKTILKVLLVFVGLALAIYVLSPPAVVLPYCPPDPEECG